MGNNIVNSEFLLDVLFCWLLVLPFIVAIMVVLYYWRKKALLRNAKLFDAENPSEISRSSAKDPCTHVTVSYSPNFNSQPTLHASRTNNFSCQNSEGPEESSSPPSYVEAIKLQVSSLGPTI